MECFIGDIYLFPFGRTPEGFFPCNGMLLQIRMYQALYSLLGTAYGGDGKTTFALPNMQGLEPMPGVQYYIVCAGYYPCRS
jgi:Microcystin-dependent protein